MRVRVSVRVVCNGWREEDLSTAPSSAGSCWAHIGAAGGVIDDTMVTKCPDHIYQVVNAGCADKCASMRSRRALICKWAYSLAGGRDALTQDVSVV